MSHDPDCLFCKIDRGVIPAEKIYEDDRVFAINDIHPMAPVHVLIIPHRHVPTLLDVQEGEYDLIGHVFQVAARLAYEKGTAESGFKVLHNVNEGGGQRVFHLHFHLLGGKKYDE